MRRSMEFWATKMPYRLGVWEPLHQLLIRDTTILSCASYHSKMALELCFCVLYSREQNKTSYCQAERLLGYAGLMPGPREIPLVLLESFDLCLPVFEDLFPGIQAT